MDAVRKNWELFVLIIAFGMLAWYPNGAQTFEEWDENGDSRISKSEFDESFESGFLSVQSDDEGFYNATYSMWDLDKDKQLSEAEWNTSADFNADYIPGKDFATFDLNSDAYLSFDEYEEALNGTDLYNEWDSDESRFLDKSEISTGVFSSWDKDDNEYLDKKEYEQFHRYYAGKE